jgi:Flp pilus assembly protein TadG
MSARASRRSRVLRYRPGARLVSRGRREDGIALVEFALVLPVLLGVLIGILQFGLMFNKYISLTDAARLGARSLSLGRGSPGNPCADAQTQLQNNEAVTLPDATVVPGYPVFGNSADNCGNPGSWNAGDSVTFKITAPYNLQVFGINFGTVHLTAQATDAIE